MEAELSSDGRNEIVSHSRVDSKGMKVGEEAFSRRLMIKNTNGEYSFNMVIVVEDFRVGVYVSFILVMIIGAILTELFADGVDGDFDVYIHAVYGVSNGCIYFDFPPATYVLPFLWGFGMYFGFIYSSASVIRIQVSYLEMKLSRCACVWLTIAHVYVVLSGMYFSTVFAVQPDPDDPVTMIIHATPYLNMKWALCILQITVVYFGINVAWVDLNFPSWFHIGSIIHIILWFVTDLVTTVLILNAQGDMGIDMEGKGLWWSVQSEANKLTFDLFGNYLGVVFGIFVPFMQAIYISRRGKNTDALHVTVSDNRVSAYNIVKNNEHGTVEIGNLAETDI